MQLTSGFRRVNVVIGEVVPERRNNPVFIQAEAGTPAVFSFSFLRGSWPFAFRWPVA
jgi:hypothetical protein